MRWCCWRCWWRLPSPRWESCWWWWSRWFPPPRGKFPRRNRSAGGQKCSCPCSASRRRRSIPKVSLLFFSRSKWLIYQKMGTGGGPRRAQYTRVRQGGLARPGGLCSPGGSLLVLIGSNISQIFHKNLRKVSACLELCRIGGLKLLFQVQISSCRNSPSLCVPCKLWEKRH